MSYVQKGSKLYLSDDSINHSDTDYAQNGNSLVLVHHGILGMKHGERRYQNKDGTLTELGKQRRRLGRKTKQTKVDDSKWHQDYRNARKDYHEMSDQELQKSVNRLRNETAYRELEYRMNHGQNKAQKILSNMGQNFVNNTANSVTQAGSRAASKQIIKLGGVALASLAATYAARKQKKMTTLPALYVGK